MKFVVPEELVRRAQQGNQDAITDLLEKSDELIRLASSDFSLGSSDTADVIQDVNVEIIKKLVTLRKPESYFFWVRRITKNLCIDFLRKKKSVLLEKEAEIEDDLEDQSIFDSQGFEKSSYEEFKKTERDIEYKERIERVSKILDQEAFERLKLKYVYGLSLQEITSLGNLKKSSYAEQIKIDRAQWLLIDANYDYEASNFEDAKWKLLIIISQFKPDESSKEKRYLLASALRRLAGIYQNTGDPDESIDLFLRSQKIWDGLNDKAMVLQINHKIALCNNIKGNYEIALEKLKGVGEGYINYGPDTKPLYGDLQRDIGSIYNNMGKVELAKSIFDKSLELLKDSDLRESYLAALRKCGEIATELGDFDKAEATLQASIEGSPPYRALHHLQTDIAFADLFFSAGDADRGLDYAKKAKQKAIEFGFLHQLSILNKILKRHGFASLN